MPENEILIIDDDGRNIFALSAVLRARGYSTIGALSSTEGIDILLKNRQVSIVLMDIMMPDMDGYETISRIRQHNELDEVTIIAVTAQAMPGDREKCLAAGAAGYISKPVDVDKLLELLRKFESGNLNSKDDRQ
jgi:two-component system, cell cycle response regulator DivK